MVKNKISPALPSKATKSSTYFAGGLKSLPDIASKHKCPPEKGLIKGACSKLTLNPVNQIKCQASSRSLTKPGETVLPKEEEDKRTSLSEIEKNAFGRITKDWRKSIILFLLSCVIGLLFGFCAEKSKVYKPRAIREQFAFSNFLLMKLHLTSIAAAQVILCVASLIPAAKSSFFALVDNFASNFTGKGAFQSFLGPFILGVGMVISGSCPSLALIQVATGVTNSSFAIVGALFAALVYTLLLDKFGSLDKSEGGLVFQTIFQKFNLQYALFACPMAICLSLTVYTMEVFYPQTYDRQDSQVVFNSTLSKTSPTVLHMKVWPVYAAGCTMGALHLLTTFTTMDTLEITRSYVTIVSQWLVTTKLQSMFPRLAQMRWGFKNWWQMFYILGILLGALTSSLLSGSFTTTEGVHPAAALSGGVLMLTGARVSAGCITGNFLSGMAVLAWLSFIAVPSMYIGGFVAAFLLDIGDALDMYYAGYAVLS